MRARAEKLPQQQQRHGPVQDSRHQPITRVVIFHCHLYLHPSTDFYKVIIRAISGSALYLSFLSGVAVEATPFLSYHATFWLILEVKSLLAQISRNSANLCSCPNIGLSWGSAL